MLINKTSNDLAVPVTLAQPVTANAQMFSYSGADLTAIHKLAPVPFSGGAGSVAVPGLSMNMLVMSVK